ncbi:ABC transporter ATP-binding protein/permease [Helcobacillus sp. ACRRO]|uniref:ABC transporter ATP-binding protein n=1 Tax=Helcobacillus sp. ACRRO TaxID=2918202 RepID=UPI001EF5507D|nr:ABC transporter ATP-binding protein [Helcobacillus sp. ACRRO]MCG7426702.1 ABC transporter ATP-binding protein/permease [Helcobacillus sp. ACRRO]
MSADEKDTTRGLRPGQKSKNFLPSAKRLLGQMRPERPMLIAAIITAVASVALAVVGPKILGRATDIIFSGVISKHLPPGTTKQQVIEQARAAGNEKFADMLGGMELNPGHGIDFSALWAVLGLVTALYAVSAVLNWLQGILLVRVALRVVKRLRRQTEEKIHSLPLSYFDRTSRGDVLSRVTNDIDNIQQTLIQTIGGIVTSLLTVIGTIAMMLWISPLLTLIAMIVIPLAGVITAVVGKRAQKLFAEQWDATGKVNGEVEEAFSGHDVVSVFGREKQIADEFERENAELFRASFGAQFVSSLIMPLMMFAGNLSYVAVAVVGGLRVVSGQLTLGDVQAFIQYSRQFTQPLSQLASMATMLQSGVASAERVFDLLDEPDEISDAATAELAARAAVSAPAAPAPSATGAEAGEGPTGSTAVTALDADTAPADQVGRGRVEFQHVAFSYAKDRPLITDLSLTAEPGTTVAIVGPTGAGKTTLVNLLMRFYEVDAGRILLDGVDTRALTRADLRSRTAMVLQDTWLFGGTVRENIRYGRLDATDAEVEAAAKAACAHEFIMQMPGGYDSVLEDEGTTVSAGEKQLLTIARAFLAEPELLILDEATSSVDTRTEVLVQEAMSRLRSGRTAFVIAHRLSTIRDADLILVMEHGNIVEQGDHDSLMAAGGAYSQLHRSQFEAPAVDLDEQEAAEEPDHGPAGDTAAAAVPGSVEDPSAGGIPTPGAGPGRAPEGD